MAQDVRRFRTLLGTFLIGLGLAHAHAAPELVVPAKAFNHALPKSVLKAERGVTRARTVTVDTGALQAARDGIAADGAPRAMRIELFDGQAATVLITEAETGPDGTQVYRGHVPGRAFSSFTMTQVGKVVAANIVAPDYVFQLRYAGDGLHEVREIDQAQFDDHAGYKPIPVDAPPLAKDMAVASDSADIIDVMVAYTTAAKTGAGGATAMATLIALGITETNDAYAAAGVTQRLRLAHSMEITSYTESGNMSTDLTRLQLPTDGFLDEVHAARDTYAADFVSLWVENGGGGCGIGYLMTTISSGFASSAFNVTARSCATGNYSFGHELGHNMGLRHDTYVDSATTPFAYAHGYVDTTNRFRTVMAYNDQCSVAGFNCTRIKGFSNTTHQYSGFAMGNAATANNAAVLNATAPTTANFRSAAASLGFTTDVTKSVSEGAGSVTLSVVRGGSIAAAASVAWSTTSGTATAGADFTTASGTLSWAAGDAAAKTITVPIVQDSLVESVETFTVTLASPVGAVVSPSGATSTVSILDDEPGVFPVGCALPAGWVQQVGTTAGWAATSATAYEGTCSLKAGTVTHSQTAGVEYTATVAAGTLSFRYKVSSETDWDCLRFAIDGTFQNINGSCTNNAPGASGATDWVLASFPVAAGTHTFRWNYGKDSSVSEGSDTAWIDDVRYLANTAATVTASAASSAVGQAVTFTATVTGGSPTGSVAFRANGSDIGGCATVTLSSGSAACTTTILPIGVHSITVAYGGDLGHAASNSSALTHTVNAAPAATSTSLSAPTSTTVNGQAITFTAVVSAVSGTPTGTVTFKDGAAAIPGCSARPLAGGSTTCTVSALTVGVHAITAEYSGAATFATSVSPQRAHSVIGGGTPTAAHLLWRHAGNGDVYRMNVNGMASPSGALVYREAGLAWKIVGNGDLDGDGIGDMLYRHDTNGEVYAITLSQAGTVTGKAKIHTEPNAAWRILPHIADLDGDGRQDILWWNSSTGQLYAMLMNGTAIAAGGLVYTEADTNWQVVAVGDFHGIGRKNQLLWRHAITGQVYLQAVTFTAGAFAVSGAMVYHEPSSAWRILGAPDLDGNGRSDILWRNSSTGQVYGMLMNGSAIASQGIIYTEGNTAWKIVSHTDLDANGRADLLWRNDATGQVYLMLMNGLGIASQGMLYTEPDPQWRILGPWEFAAPFGGP